MGKLTAKQVIAYSKAAPKKYSDGEGLYFCVRKQGSPYWMIRYTTAKGRREPLKARVAEVKASMPNSNAIADIEREIAIQHLNTHPDAQIYSIDIRSR